MNMIDLEPGMWLKMSAVASLCCVLFFPLARSVWAEESAVVAATPEGSTQVLFAFDDESFPLIRGVELKMQRPEKRAGNPIIARGGEDAPDAIRAQTPAVLRVDDRWQMWYSAHDGTGVGGLRVAYAESDDGIHWRKPNLGLVEYKGSRDNNLVDAQPGLNTVSVFFDPDAPPERRYVMAGEDMRWWGKQGGTGWSLAGPSITRIDVSPDGLHWTAVLDRPGLIMPQNETGTIYRFGGLYHVGGQQIAPLLRLPMQEHPLGLYLGPRTFVVWRSPRLDRWPLEYTRAFFKPMQSSSPYRVGWDREEVHLGAAVTPVGGICIGVYGQWHHPVSRKAQEAEIAANRGVTGGYQPGGDVEYFGPRVSVDLGLIVSNDGLHFREPAPGFTLIARDQELAWDRDFRENTDQDNLLLIQGSIVNTSETTFIYYSASTPGGNTAGVRSNIGVATLPRNRFSYLQMIPGSPVGGYVATRVLTLATDRQLFANADLPPGASLRFSLLDADGLDTLPGYGFDDMAEAIESGLDGPVRWKGHATLPRNVPFRIRAHLQGKARVYALRLTSPPKP
jgi:hypothetical protein